MCPSTRYQSLRRGHRRRAGRPEVAEEGGGAAGDDQLRGRHCQKARQAVALENLIPWARARF